MTSTIDRRKFVKMLGLLSGAVVAGVTAFEPKAGPLTFDQLEKIHGHFRRCKELGKHGLVHIHHMYAPRFKIASQDGDTVTLKTVNCFQLNKEGTRAERNPEYAEAPFEHAILESDDGQLWRAIVEREDINT